MIAAKIEAADDVSLGGEMCPECGGHMKVKYHPRESGSLFVWFECAARECGGQLLRKWQPAAPPHISV